MKLLKLIFGKKSFKVAGITVLICCIIIPFTMWIFMVIGEHFHFITNGSNTVKIINLIVIIPVAYGIYIILRNKLQWTNYVANQREPFYMEIAFFYFSVLSQLLKIITERLQIKGWWDYTFAHFVHSHNRLCLYILSYVRLAANVRQHPPKRTLKIVQIRPRSTSLYRAAWFRRIFLL